MFGFIASIVTVIVLVTVVLVFQSHMERSGLSKCEDDNFGAKLGIVHVPGYAGATRGSGYCSCCLWIRRFRFIYDRHRGGRTINVHDALGEFIAAAAAAVVAAF